MTKLATAALLLITALLPLKSSAEDAFESDQALELQRAHIVKAALRVGILDESRGQPITATPAYAWDFIGDTRGSAEISVDLTPYETDAHGIVHQRLHPYALLSRQVIGAPDGCDCQGFVFPQLDIDWAANTVVYQGRKVGRLVPDNSYPHQPYRIELQGYRPAYQFVPQGDGRFTAIVFLEKSGKTALILASQTEWCQPPNRYEHGFCWTPEDCEVGYRRKNGVCTDDDGCPWPLHYMYGGCGR